MCKDEDVVQAAKKKRMDKTAQLLKNQSEESSKPVKSKYKADVKSSVTPSTPDMKRESLICTKQLATSDSARNSKPANEGQVKKVGEFSSPYAIIDSPRESLLHMEELAEFPFSSPQGSTSQMTKSSAENRGSSSKPSELESSLFLPLDSDDEDVTEELSKLKKYDYTS